MVNPRALIKRGRGAIGAVGAQLAQALASLVLSIAAARTLGAEGLGVFGLIIGGLVLATAIATGLVGDSLTVLDRKGPRVRAGLQVVALGSGLLAGLVAVVVCVATNLLSWPAALVFGAASALFILEEFLRRLLMASLRFWSVMAVDITVLVVTAAWIGLMLLIGSLGMTQLLSAMVVAQAVGMVVAVRLLPPGERHLAPWRDPDIASVFRFGSWRAAQQAVRPAMLTAMRILVVLAAGTAAFGELEAARVYTAPTLLIVNGIGGFLFATYAAKRDRPLSELVRHADIGAGAMFTAVLTAGAVAAALLPWAGSIITGGEFPISELAAFGWVVYSATAAVLMPYGSLASVTGWHVRVFTLRLVESAVSLGAVALVLFGLDASPSWVPFAMALGTVVLGVIIRQVVLVPEARRGSSLDAATPTPTGASA